MKTTNNRVLAIGILLVCVICGGKAPAQESASTAPRESSPSRATSDGELPPIPAKTSALTTEAKIPDISGTWQKISNDVRFKAVIRRDEKTNAFFVRVNPGAKSTREFRFVWSTTDHCFRATKDANPNMLEQQWELRVQPDGAANNVLSAVVLFERDSIPDGALL